MTCLCVCEGFIDISKASILSTSAKSGCSARLPNWILWPAECKTVTQRDVVFCAAAGLQTVAGNRAQCSRLLNSDRDTISSRAVAPPYWSQEGGGGTSVVLIPVPSTATPAQSARRIYFGRRETSELRQTGTSAVSRLNKNGLCNFCGAGVAQAV
jgi:hypothetical protein